VAPVSAVLGSSALSEEELMDQMERCVYPNTEFHHADHIRLGWHYLRTYGYPEAVERMEKTILSFAVSLGHAEKYHTSVTVGWMRLIDAGMRCTPQCGGFAQFLDAHPWLLNREALLAFYSRERLGSEEARTAWVEPDLYPLPGIAITP
jgi:hypothetical protein